MESDIGQQGHWARTLRPAERKEVSSLVTPTVTSGPFPGMTGFDSTRTCSELYDIMGNSWRTLRHVNRTQKLTKSDDIFVMT
jgi:hypothetical protein